MPTVLGLDLGGTKLAIVRYDARTWKLQASEKRMTAGKTFPVIVGEMLELIGKLRASDTAAIGIGVPGLIERPRGRILTLPNISEGDGFPLREKITKATKLPVVVDNDSSCFTLAEALQGGGKGYDIVVGITMGTGVGGGIVIDGHLFHGSHGFAAEFGHMLLKPGEPPQGIAEGRGEIEEYFSGTALRKRCPQAKKPEEILQGQTCASLHPQVIREVAWMCCSLTHCIDPEIIVFGGGAGRALKPHLPKIAEGLMKWMLPKTPAPKLAIGALPDAGTLGAALLTQESETAPAKGRSSSPYSNHPETS